MCVRSFSSCVCSTVPVPARPRVIPLLCVQLRSLKTGRTAPESRYASLSPAVTRPPFRDAPGLGELGQFPVDRLGALLFQETISAAERMGTEKSVMGRIWTRMRRLDARYAAEQWHERPRVAAPQDRDQRCRFPG